VLQYAPAFVTQALPIEYCAYIFLSPASGTIWKCSHVRAVGLLVLALQFAITLVAIRKPAERYTTGGCEHRSPVDAGPENVFVKCT
jgi:hypothetical protein